MARSRNIKPGFFKNELLVEIPFEFRLLFVGLWTYADREGRFEYRPRRIKADLFPYEEINVEDGIAALAERGFLFLYIEDGGVEYVQIKNWAKHQSPHHKETGSTIPPPPGHTDTVCAGYIPLSNTIRRRIYARDGRVCRECKAEHGLSIDHIIPISRGGNSTDDNLQVLCLSCNARKSNKLDASFKHGASMPQASGNKSAPSPLIPDSLIPDSGFLIPEKSVPASPASPAPKARASRKPVKTPMPDDFAISERVRKWAAAKGHDRLDEHFESFVGKALANGYRYENWDEALMNAIRGDWARLNERNARAGPAGSPQPSKQLRGVAAILGVNAHDLTDHRSPAVVLEADRDVPGGLVPAEPRRLPGR